MVGIVGFFSKHLAEKSLLNNMIDSLKHQGTYCVDTYFDEHFACARVHRGIFNSEPQPIFNKEKSLCIFFDGKIYGYQDQLEALKKRGYVFHYQNDPEFCLNSYEEYGKNFIKQLNGSFVFILHDFTKGRTILVNDRYGHNVHYYAVQNDKFFFAPEIKAILQDTSFKKELNNEAVAEFFTFGEFWDTKTFFKGINILRPATILTYEKQKVSSEKYWEFTYIADYQKTQKEFVDKLVTAYKNAVQIRMQDTLRHSVTLSGGLDSRTVVAGIPLEKRKNVITCTFGSKKSDEVKIAKKVSSKAGIGKHIVLEISPQLLIDNAENEVWLTEGRSYIGVSFGYPLLSKIKDKTDVIFDGYALDLTLGGGYLKKEILSCKDDEQLRDILHRIFFKKRIFQDTELPLIFTKEYYDIIKELPGKLFDSEFNKVTADTPPNKSDQIFINTRVSYMQIGDVPVRDLVELSHPTADNDFVDIIRAIPPEWRFGHFIYRKFFMKLSPELVKIPYNRTLVRPDASLLFWRIGRYYIYGSNLLKRKMHILFGGKIFLEKKHSYVNFDEWFRTNEQWQSFFKELLLNKDSKSKKYLNQDYIKQLLEEQITGKYNHAMKLMYLATFELFFRKFLNTDALT